MNKPEKNYYCQKENKNTQINIRLTTKEKELLQRLAQASEMSLGRFLITAGLNPKSIKVVPEINKSLYLWTLDKKMGSSRVAFANLIPKEEATY